MSDSFISWYFDIKQSPCQYGSTVWQISNRPKKAVLHLCRSGTIELSDICELVAENSQYDKISLDKTPENEIIRDRLRNKFSIYIELIERTATLSEQITKYSLMFGKERFFLGDLKQYRDLIFDDIDLNNIVDPVLTDEQTGFPMTQALLVGCHYYDRLFHLDWIGKS